jgi:hypothetical protein
MDLQTPAPAANAARVAPGRLSPVAGAPFTGPTHACRA